MAQNFFMKYMHSKDIFGLNNQRQIEIINFLNRNYLPFLNFALPLCILSTILVSVASREHSFSKLIKIYLRSSVSQERLKNLTTFSIENDICVELGIKELIFTFINLKTGKI